MNEYDCFQCCDSQHIVCEEEVILQTNKVHTPKKVHMYVCMSCGVIHFNMHNEGVLDAVQANLEKNRASND